MTEVLLPGAIHRQTEFVQNLTGACGPNALAMGEAWANQHSAVDTYSVYLDMRSRGLLANVNGASTIEQLRQEAVVRGLPITGYRAYGEPWADWRTFYSAHVGQHYILMETANGQALRDSISGTGENATNLHYHFIGVVGHHDGGFSLHAGRDLPPGWWCCDGDNYAAGDALQFYPDDVMAAAQPCAALAFAAKVSIAPMAWTRQADGTGKDAKGHICGAGIMGELAAKGITADGRRSETYLPGLAPVESFLTLTNGDVLTWDGHTVGHDGASVIEGLLRQQATVPPADPQVVKDAALGKGLRALLTEAAA